MHVSPSPTTPQPPRLFYAPLKAPPRPDPTRGAGASVPRERAREALSGALALVGEAVERARPRLRAAQYARILDAAARYRAALEALWAEWGPGPRVPGAPAGAIDPSHAAAARRAFWRASRLALSVARRPGEPAARRFRMRAHARRAQRALSLVVGALDDALSPRAPAYDARQTWLAGVL
jgi:hypothetical protein